MTTLPATGSFVAEAGTNFSRGELFEAWLASTKELPGGGPQQSLTISGGVITPTYSTVIIDTEGAALSDDLDRIAITNRYDGAFIFLRITTDTRKVRVRSAQGGSGQILLHGISEIFLDQTGMLLVLQLEGTSWSQRILEFAGNDGAFRTYHGLNDTATYPAASNSEATLGTSTTRLITPATLQAAFDNYQALVGNRPTRTTIDPADELLIGTNDGSNDIVGKISLANAMTGGFHRHWYSGELTLTAGTQASHAHGLAGRPSLVQASILCKTTEHGWAVGDEVLLDNMTASSESRGVAVGFGLTDVFYRVKSGQNIGIISWTNGDTVVINPANWRLILRAWR